MEKTAAVIGGSGFVGRAVVEMLARAGWRVIVLCRNAERAKFLKPMGVAGQVSVVSGNALSDAGLEQVIAPADAVVNLVGILFEGGSQRFNQLQAELPGRIGQLVGRYGVEDVVHLSAIGADTGSKSHYARSKGAGEVALQAAFPDAVILRPSIVFGPRDGFFNRFASLAMIAPALPLPGGGKMQMQPVYVGDVVAAVAIVLGITKPVKLARGQKIRGSIFELGGPEVFTFRELMDVTLAAINRRRMLVPVPLAMMSLGAVFTGLLPTPPLTRDQVRLLAVDNITTDGVPGLGALGITPTPVASIIPGYLASYRPGGAFSRLG